MLIATESAVYCLKDNGKEKPDLLVDGLDVRRVIEGEKRNVVALADRDIILLDCEEKRRLHTNIKDRIDSLCILKEKPLDMLIGTTPPFLYRFREDDQAERIKSFDEIEVRNKWYTPWGGPAAVRSLASTKDGWIYADIHVGSIMRSPDHGNTWEPVTPTLHKDVHQVSTTPASKKRVYANTFLSVYISDDRGNTWEHRSKNLNNRYGRGITIHPEDPDTVLCGVSDGPRGTNVHGQLYHTTDAGLNWTHINKGFPKSTRKNIDTFHITYAENDLAWVSDEENLYMSIDRGRTWSTHWKAADKIIMISCFQ